MLGRKLIFQAIVFVGLAAALPAEAAERLCRIASIEGDDVRLWRDGVWSAIGPGPLPAGESKIVTGHASRAEIQCDDGVVVTVGVATELNLEELAGEAGRGEDIVLQLIRGITGLVAQHRSWRRFEVRTPLAIASVRSTEWLVESTEAGGAAVFVREGRVALRVMAGTLTLEAGEGVTLGPGDRTAPVVAWGAPRVSEAGQRLGFGWRN